VSQLLRARLLQFERARACWQARAGTWLALDFEQWERDHTLVTECGWARIRPRDEARAEGHLVVRYPGGAFYNGTFVPDHRAHYQFGASEEVSRAELAARVGALIADAAREGPVFLVFHDPRDDVKYGRRARLWSHADVRAQDAA
jgi:hypothetical protein